MKHPLQPICDTMMKWNWDSLTRLPQKLEVDMSMILRMCRDQDYPLIIDVARRIVEQAPSSAVAWYNLAVTLFHFPEKDEIGACVFAFVMANKYGCEYVKKTAEGDVVFELHFGACNPHSGKRESVTLSANQPESILSQFMKMTNEEAHTWWKKNQKCFEII